MKRGRNRAGRLARFTPEQVGAAHYVLAGTPAAEEYGLRGAVECVNCGKPIAHVFVTDVGPMGGDCLATITGDDSTRKVVQRMMRDRHKFTPIVARDLVNVTAAPAYDGKGSVLRARWRDSGRSQTIGHYSTNDLDLVARVAQGIVDDLEADRYTRTMPREEAIRFVASLRATPQVAIERASDGARNRAGAVAWFFAFAPRDWPASEPPPVRAWKDKPKARSIRWAFTAPDGFVSSGSGRYDEVVRRMRDGREAWARAGVELEPV